MILSGTMIVYNGCAEISLARILAGCMHVRRLQVRDIASYMHIIYARSD